jgi:hypothetical protein
LIRSAFSRRLALGIAALLTILLLPPVASANRPWPPRQLDTVSVSGDNVVIDRFSVHDIEVNAFSGRSGRRPGGFATFTPIGLPPVSGPVSCMNVNDNVAVLTLQGPFEPYPGILGFSLRVVDNGGSGLDIFQYWPADPEVPDPIDCKVGSQSWFGGALIGRAVVHDAPAPPTRRWQCRRGGWAKFGFRSKKQCLRFVKRHRH